MKRRTNNMALVGLFFGVCSVLCCCMPLFPVLGVIFSVLGISQINKNPDSETGKGYAVAGIILSALGIVLVVALAIIGVGSANFQPNFDPDNMKQMDELLKKLREMQEMIDGKKSDVWLLFRLALA